MRLEVKFTKAELIGFIMKHTGGREIDVEKTNMWVENVSGLEDERGYFNVEDSVLAIEWEGDL